MALSEEKYVVMSEGEPGGRNRENWLDILSRWLVRCPRCAEVWLAIGVHESERYICKDCGHNFAIKSSVAHTNKLAANRGP